MYLRLKILVCTLLALPFVSVSQLQVTPGIPAATLATSAFGNGITVQGLPEINCNAAQYGAFTNGLTTSLGFNSGLIMSTGNASAAPNPQTSNASTGLGVNFNDPQLTAISAGATNDACIITITIVPQCNTLALRFVFGSEEYPEFVGGSFNDVFGFFVSGENPSGPAYNNYNVAQLPNGTPVSINSVNANSNSAYYVNNAGNSMITYDGLTTVLLPVLNVVPCQPYVFKLAIADAGDSSYDSAIFIDFISCATSVAAVSPVIVPATCSDANGSISLGIEGGTGPFEIAWQNYPDSTGLSLHNIPSGQYTLNVLDLGVPCATVSTFTYTVPDGSTAPATNITVNDASICQGQEITVTGTGAETYDWITNNGSFSGTSFNMIAEEDQWIYVNGTNICGELEDSLFINVTPTPTLNPEVSIDTLCAGQSFQLIANSNMFGTVQWTGPLGFSSNQTNPTINNASANASGTYNANLIVNGCASGIQSVSVLVYPTPMAFGSVLPLVCEGGNIQMGAQPTGESYLWTGPNGFSSTEQVVILNNATPEQSGVYTLQTFLGQCPSAPSSYNVLVTNAPEISMPETYVVCDGQPLFIIPSLIAGATYQWTGPNGFTATSGELFFPSVGPNELGQYSLVATVANCPSSASSTTVVSLPFPAAVPTISDNEVCLGEQVIFGVNSWTGATYEWTGPNGFFSNEQNPSIVTANESNEGQYTVVINANGCISNPQTVSLIVNPIPSVNAFASNALCQGEDIFMFSDAFGNVSYQWTGPAGFSSTLPEPVITGALTSNAGDYTLVITENGCSSSPSSATVVVYPSPIVNVSHNGPLCEGENLVLSTASNATSFTWTGPQGFSSTNPNPVINAVTLAQSGTYTVVGMLNNCFSDPITANIIVNQNPTVSISGNSPICFGELVILTCDGLTNAQWVTPEGAANGLSLSSTPSTNFTYTVQGTDANGCEGDAQWDVVVIHPYLVIDSLSINAFGNTDSTEGYAPFDLTVHVTTNVESYVWYTGDSTIVLAGNTIDFFNNYTFFDEGYYTSYFIGELQGCPVMDSLLVETFGVAMLGCDLPVGECDGGEIPNIVTQDGDLKNEVFWIPNLFLQSLDVHIFNRWGNEVGSITQPAQYFDDRRGHWNPREVENGIYYYTAVGKGFDGQIIKRNGSFHVMK